MKKRLFRKVYWVHKNMSFLEILKFAALFIYFGCCLLIFGLIFVYNYLHYIEFISLLNTVTFFCYNTYIHEDIEEGKSFIYIYKSREISMISLYQVFAEEEVTVLYTIFFSSCIVTRVISFIYKSSNSLRSSIENYSCKLIFLYINIKNEFI